MSRTQAKILGALTGLAIAGYAVAYVPMIRNHAECGKLTLCHP